MRFGQASNDSLSDTYHYASNGAQGVVTTLSLTKKLSTQGGDRVVEQFTQAIAEIAADSRSGAAQIANRAANVLLQRASAGQAPSAEAFRREILASGWALIRAHTVMAPLVNLVNTVLWRMEAGDSPQLLREAVGEATDEFKRQLRQHTLHMAEGTLGLVSEGSKIVTISNSSTIQHALIHAQRAGRHFEVICAESFPDLEGREAARLLRSCGVSATVVDDAAAREAIADADLVLVGADMLMHRGLVNKVGTYPMALVAREHGTPVYTVCGSEKFLPPGFRPFERGELAPNVIDVDQPWRLNTSSLPFDFTPIELLTGIITEQGILPVEAVEAWLAATRLHPALANHAAEAVF